MDFSTDSKILLDRLNSTYTDFEKCQTAYELRYAVAYEAAIRNEAIQQALKRCLVDKKCEDAYKFGFTWNTRLYYLIANLNLLSLKEKLKSFRWQSSEKKLILLDYQYQFIEFCKKFNDKNSSKFRLAKKKDQHVPPKTLPYKILTFPNGADTVIHNNRAGIRDNGKIRNADSKDYKKFTHLILEPKFIRPRLQPINKKTFYVDLNFELPKVELIDYVESLYDMYQQEEIPSPLEIFHLTEHENSGETTYKDVAKHAKKFGDMFFVYDYFRHYKDSYKSDSDLYEKINSDLIYSYTDNSRDPLANNTIRNYIKNMTKLSEELGYLELLTGTKRILE